MALFIGIDPGKHGGIACISEHGITAVPMPTTDRDLFDVLMAGKQMLGEMMAYVEAVHAMPKQGVTSAFTFGKGYGALLMALTAAGIPYELVTPQKWQKALGCLTKGDKNVTKAKAQQLWPEMIWTHAISDAALIAEYGRRLRT
jgi:crossover junction endodeoxyribonuclease RuvC